MAAWPTCTPPPAERASAPGPVVAAADEVVSVLAAMALACVDGR